MGLVERPLRRLDHRNAVLRVPHRLIESTDLGAHLLADRKSSCIISCAVDPKTGGQLVNGLLQQIVGSTQRIVGKKRRYIMVHSHFS